MPEIYRLFSAAAGRRFSAGNGSGALLGFVKAALLLLRLMVLFEQGRGAQGRVGGYSILASLSKEHQHCHRDNDRANGKERHQKISPALATSLGLIVFKSLGGTLIHIDFKASRSLRFSSDQRSVGNILCGRGNVQRR